MNVFNEWLDEQRGRTKWLANIFGISHAAVNQWRVSGPPKERIRDIHRLTNIPYEQLIDPFAPASKLVLPKRKPAKTNGHKKK